MPSLPISSPDDARAVAEAFLDDAVRPSFGETAVVTTTVRQFATCWAIGWNTRAYVEGGNISDALAGNGAIIVNRRTGKARMGLAALPTEAQLDSE
jgi:hypothetical protein